MNKRIKRIIAVCLCAALSISCVGIAFAQTNSGTQAQTQSNIARSTQTQTASQEAVKDETVYVIAGSDGSVQKIIVSDWIKNELSSDTLTDKSELTNIENVKSDESYSVNGNNMKVWDAQGNDIYYQGSIEKELPVDMTVTYMLDGKKVSADELAGKSGKVKIRFDYENHQYETVEIDGKQEKIYVPFAMITGMMLDSDTFRNVSVTNGKLINDGDHTIVAGFALPGLQENLGLDSSKLEIPSYVEITADVTDFEFGMTITIATNELFSGFDVSKLNASDLTDSLSELTEAMEALTDGSSSLYDGLCTLLEKSDELVSGINQLAEGAAELKSGADSLSSGAALIHSKLGELSAGLNTLSDSSSALNSGATQVFNSLLSTATQQIRSAGIEITDLTISNYADVLNSVISSLDETAVYNRALQQVTAAVEAKRPEITEQVTEAVRAEVQSQVTEAVSEQVTAGVTETVREQVESLVIANATGMTKDEYDAAVNAGLISEEQQESIENAISQQMDSTVIKESITLAVSVKMESDEIQTIISENTDEQMQSDKVQGIIAENTEAQVQKAISDAMTSDEVQSQLTAASEGAKSIIALKASLDSYNSFYLGLITYTAGVDSAASGATALNSGAADLDNGVAELKAGVDKLYNGVLTLKNNTPALVNGVTQLRDGSMELSNGIKQLNEEGIEKLVELVNGDLDGLISRLKATVDVSKNYRSFAGISEDMDGQVKFIYKTDAISAD